MQFFSRMRPSYCLVAFFSNGFLAFGMYNIHTVSGITEGGILGLTLLLDHWFGISPAISSFLLNAISYYFGWRMLGATFIGYSLVAACGYSAAYAICELFPPLWPAIAGMPLLAALVGALFVGIGAGFCVRVGGATCGDDALAMCLSRLLNVEIQWIFLVSDLTVLLLSLTYIPISKIGYSLVTVVLSGQLIGWIQKIKIGSDGEDAR